MVMGQDIAMVTAGGSHGGDKTASPGGDKAFPW